MKHEQPIWKWFGFESRQEGCVAQDWFNGLDIDAQLEILNMIGHLRVLPGGKWSRPDYDPLLGEGGISELRPKDVRTAEGNKTYRIYGVREYPDKHSYTFLHGTDKEQKNDRDGKDIARRRLRQLLENRGSIQEFDFEG